MKHFSILTIIIFCIFPVFIYAQDGNAPRATESPTDTPTQADSTEAPVGAVVRTQAPLPSPTPRPSPPAGGPTTPSDTPTASVSILPTNTTEENGNNNVLLLGGLAVAAVATLVGFVMKAKKSEPENKDGNRCLNIKKLLDDKINELTDLRGQLGGKIKEKGEEKLKEIIIGTTVAEVLELVQKAEKEVARLEKLFKECVIEFEKVARVIVIHGCADDQGDETYNKHWMPWFKKELAKKGIRAEIPSMPNPWAPSYADFKKEFEKNKVSEDSILIGHSCGCAFLVRWLGETKKHIKKLILVAPWKIADQNDSVRKDFYESPIDTGVRSRIKEIVMFTSGDEEADGKKSLTIFHDILGGKIVDLKNKGHYTLEDMKTEEFPELLQEIK